MVITDNTRLVDLTVGQLMEVITSTIEPKPQQPIPAITTEPKRIAYGIDGFRQIFGISKTTYYNWGKNGYLKELAPAISKIGRTIAIDVDLALELGSRMNLNRNSNEANNY